MFQNCVDGWDFRTCGMGYGVFSVQMTSVKSERLTSQKIRNRSASRSRLRMWCVEVLVSALANGSIGPMWMLCGSHTKDAMKSVTSLIRTYIHCWLSQLHRTLCMLLLTKEQLSTKDASYLTVCTSHVQKASPKTVISLSARFSTRFSVVHIVCQWATPKQFPQFM